MCFGLKIAAFYWSNIWDPKTAVVEERRKRKKVKHLEKEPQAHKQENRTL